MRYRHRRTAVIALGGNALAPAGERATIHDQFRYTRESLGPIVDLALAGWSVCVVHGNGPQVGDELVRNEVAREEAVPLPLGVLVAATAGWIGYMIQQSLENALRRANSPRCVATIVTQVEVDPERSGAPQSDEVHRPRAHARARARGRGGRAHRQERRQWAAAARRRQSGAARPSSRSPSIKALVEKGMLVIAAGGGGAPVYEHPSLGWEGIDAVVDKDLAAAVLARDVGAELLMILTDVDAVYADWGTPQPAPPRQRCPPTPRHAWTPRRPSAREAWRRRFAPPSSSCAARKGAPSSRRCVRGCRRSVARRERPSPQPRRPSEHPRVSGERHSAARRRADSAGRSRDDARRRRSHRAAVRRHGRRQGAGARRRPRQGRAA